MHYIVLSSIRNIRYNMQSIYRLCQKYQIRTPSISVARRNFGMVFIKVLELA